ncbi:MAG: hypothetical protein JSS66_09915 [Armatimonadetes bacterium]|nr:hypothetical protein [Armatimonadota bacterium]
MKKPLNRWLASVLALSFLGLAAVASAQAERQHPCGLYKMRALAPFFSQDASIAAADSDTDLRHYKLEIELLPTQSRVQGTSTVTLDSKVDNLTTIRLYLDGNSGQMTVSSVGGAASSFSLSGDVLTLTLDRAYANGEQFVVSVNYGGVPRNTGFGSFLFGKHGTSQQWCISSLSEPFFARTWWPCKDVLGDKADSSEVWITCPNTLTGVSNGTLQGTDVLTNNRVRYRWQENYPIVTYLVSVAVSDYGLYQLTYNHLGGTMPLTYYLFPEHNGTNSTSRQLCDLNKTQVEKLADVFGQFPFIQDKYGMAEVTGSGAYMEHQTCSSMLDTTHESVNAHELTHQWWGDMVTCGSWADIWLNEGFATYGESIWEEQKNNGSFTSYRNAMLAREPSNFDAKVYRTNLTDVNSIFSGTVYYKGAWVLHMLRGVVGMPMLQTILSNYRTAFSYKSALTTDLAAVATQTWGRDLTFFFNEWIMQPGSPDYQFNWRDDLVGSQHRLRLALWQKQNTRGYGLITMPVKIRVTTTAGTVDVSLWNDDWTDVYDIALPGQATAVALDPDTWILANTRTKVTTAIPALPLLGDMNNDGKVNLKDTPLFRACLMGQVTDHTVIDRGDFNYNGIVDADDDAVFKALIHASGVVRPNG